MRTSSVTARTFRRSAAMIAGLALVMIVAAPAPAGEAFPPGSESVEAGGEKVFSEQIDVNLVNLTVTVVGRDGRPIRGLGLDDFVVREDGEPREVANVSEIVAGRGPGLELAHHVAFLFDNSSLDKRSRRRALSSLEPRMEGLAGAGVELLVATASGGGELTIVQPLTSEAASIAAALDLVAGTHTTGEIVKGSKRELKRSLNAARTTTSMMGTDGFYDPGSTTGEVRSYGVRSQQSTKGAYASGQFSRSQATQFLDQIERIRVQEHARMIGALISVDRLVRAFSGLPGRNEVVWIGEDLAAQPAVSVYQTFFDRFSNWQRELGLERTDEWAARLDVRRELEYVANSAQAGGVAVHVVDVGDRDSDAAAATFDASRVWSAENTTPLAPGASAGYDPSMALDGPVGVGHLVEATGGLLLVGPRESDNHAERLAELMGSHYSLGFRPVEAADGMLHPVAVTVTRDDAAVRYRHQVRHSTSEQALADLALSRFLIDEGPNPLGLEVAVGDAEPIDQERVIREVGVTVSAGVLGLENRDDRMVGRLTIVLVCCDGAGNPAPPRLVQVDVALPQDRVDESTRARARVRLMMDSAAGRVSVAVRDEGSGLLGSGVALMPS